MTILAKGTSGLSSRGWSACALVIIVALTAVMRYHLLPVPLSRDEGEYAYVGQLMLQGVPPYAGAYNMRLPGIYVVYALILAAFGQTPIAVHLGLLVVSAASAALVFVLGKRLFDSTVGLLAGSGFAVVSVGRELLGLAAYSEHFVILPAVAAMVVLLRAIDRRREDLTFVSGSLVGVAVLIKQPAIFFLAFGLCYALVAGPRPRWRYSAMLAGGAALPVAVTGAGLIATRVFERFWFWNVSYASEYVTLRPLSLAAPVFLETAGPIVGGAPLFFALAGVGLVATTRDRESPLARKFLLILLAASVGSTMAGFYFRPHYFVLMMPVMALLAGRGARALGRLGAGAGLPVRAVAVAVVALGHTVYVQHVFLFRLDPRLVARTAYGANPYPEAVEIAKYIRRHTRPRDRIAVIGSEPEIYFYASRRSATGYVYVYALMEKQKYARAMQEEMIREVEAAKPTYVVQVWINYSWMAAMDSEPLLLEWFARYRDAQYERVGVVDILSVEETQYRWDNDAIGYVPRSKYWLEVLRRKAMTG